jgi:multidrug efflux system membrane fusion protein
MVEKRNIRKGQLIDGLVVIEAGVKAGDRVVVKGLQRARPGARVTPAQVEMATLTNTALLARAEKAEVLSAAGEGGAAMGDTPDDGATQITGEAVEASSDTPADIDRSPTD